MRRLNVLLQPENFKTCRELKVKYLILSSLLSNGLSGLDVNFVSLEMKWIKFIGLLIYFFVMRLTILQHNIHYFIMSQIYYYWRLLDMFYCGYLTTWLLCVCWHLLGCCTQKLNMNSLITSHFSCTRWALSKENVTSLP